MGINSSVICSINFGRYNGPFFEILINSQRTSIYETNCFPFQVHILQNRDIAENRWNQLKIIKLFSEEHARPIFYSPDLTHPGKFIELYRGQYGKDPDPNAMRILNGLKFLNTTKMKGQSTGNCWAKQPKRTVLVSLFLETLMTRPELSPGGAWKISRKLYSLWKKFYLNELKSLASQRGIHPRLHYLVMEKIRKLQA